MASDAVSTQAFQSLALLHQLTIEAGLCASEAELVFQILNRTIALCPYDRAALWDLERPQPRLLGVSGQTDVDLQAPLVLAWQALVQDLPKRDTAQALGPDAFPLQSTAWQSLRDQTQGLSVQWIPIMVHGKLRAGLWLERWGEKGWEEAEQKLLASLAVGYGAAWRPFRRGLGQARALLKRANLPVLGAIGLALFLLLFAVRIRLRIVAPCEVVAKDPHVVAAPLQGVVAQMKARPDQPVQQGDVLFVYDKHVAEEELKVAQEQVRLMEANLRQAWFAGLREPAQRAKIKSMEHRLAQERVRLRLAQENADKLEVRAPCSGVAVIEDPYAWQGRSVALGERVLAVVDPKRTRLRIWLPENDNVPFAKDIPVQVYLNIDPSTSRRALLTSVSLYVDTSPKGLPAFRAEADWTDIPKDLQVGLKGTAMVYGERVSLAYYLLRRPWLAVRRALGF